MPAGARTVARYGRCRRGTSGPRRERGPTFPGRSSGRPLGGDSFSSPGTWTVKRCGLGLASVAVDGVHSRALTLAATGQLSQVRAFETHHPGDGYPTHEYSPRTSTHPARTPFPSVAADASPGTSADIGPASGGATRTVSSHSLPRVCSGGRGLPLRVHQVAAVSSGLPETGRWSSSSVLQQSAERNPRIAEARTRPSSRSSRSLFLLSGSRSRVIGS
jgi:hypothetical protein